MSEKQLQQNLNNFDDHTLLLAAGGGGGGNIVHNNYNDNNHNNNNNNTNGSINHNNNNNNSNNDDSMIMAEAEAAAEAAAAAAEAEAEAAETPNEKSESTSITTTAATRTTKTKTTEGVGGEETGEDGGGDGGGGGIKQQQSLLLHRENPYRLVAKTGPEKVPKEEILKCFVEYNREFFSNPACVDYRSTRSNPRFMRCMCVRSLLPTTMLSSSTSSKLTMRSTVKRERKTGSLSNTTSVIKTEKALNGNDNDDENENENDDGDNDGGDNNDNDDDGNSNANDNDDDNNNNDLVPTDANDDANNGNVVNTTKGSEYERAKWQEDLFLLGIACFQLYFAKLHKMEQQIKVMDWIRYGLNNVNQKQPYMLPFFTPENTSEEDFELLKPLWNHRVCQSALMYLLGVGRSWWKTVKESAEHFSLPKENGNVGKPSGRKRRFMEQEEQDLIAFMDQIVGYATPTQTKKREGKDNIVYYLDSAWSKRYCYKRYCAQRGKQVLTTPQGRTTIVEMPNFQGESKDCISWSSFHKYWNDNYPRLRHKPPNT